MDLQKIKDVNVYFLKITRPIILMFLIYLAYLLIGSVCFVTFEAFEDIRTRNESAQEIMRARKIAITLMEAGYSKEAISLAFRQEKEVIKGTAKPQNISWTAMYGEKTFFAFILITTIGYGNVSPSSQVGRLVCIVYTLIGMPIHVIMMRLLSYEFRGLLRRALRFGQRFGSSSKIVFTVFGGLFFILFLAIFIFLPAYIFTLTDRWNYALGVYFSFVSLTTIGLGDYVAGVSGEHLHDRLYSLYVVAMLVWLMVGLGFVFMAFNTLSYMLGIGIFDILDSKCRVRGSAKRKLSSLRNVIKDLNWNLVKFTPPTFKHADNIEQFKELLVENPQDVTYEQLLDMFRIMTNLREQVYDDLSRLVSAGIPLTPIIQNARDNLPDILSQECTTVTYSGQKKAEALSKSDDHVVPGSDLVRLHHTTSAPVRTSSETDEPVESVSQFRFGSTVDLDEISSVVLGKISEDEDEGKEDEESNGANREDADEEEDFSVSVEKGPVKEEERDKKQ